MPEIDYGLCKHCGAKMVKNPHTDKIFCSAKCWLNKPDEVGSFQKAVDYSSKQVEDVKIVDKDSFLITEFVALREKVEELIKVIKSETNL